MEQWLLILLIIGGFGVILCAGVGLIVWYKRYVRTRLLAPAGPVAGSYGSASSKLWVGSGSNPTEDCAIDIHARARAIIAEQVRPADECERLERVAANFCRSCAHQRVMSAALPMLGRRRTKFWALISDARANEASLAAGGPAEAALLLTLVTPEALSATNLLPLSSVKSMAVFRSLLTSLRHPHVLPTIDAALTLDGHLAVLRPFHYEGSIRDLMYAGLGSRGGAQPVKASYYAKYESVDTLTGTVFVRPARGLRLELVARFGLQVLEALKYMDAQSVPYFHLHTGNVLISTPSRGGLPIAQISDYESAFVGYKHRLHKKLRRMPRVDPQLGAFAIFMYEITTGIEAQPLSRKGLGAIGSPTNGEPSPSPSSPGGGRPASPSLGLGGGMGLDLALDSPHHFEINDLISRIVHATHEVGYDELLAHNLFRAVKPVQFVREPSRGPLDARMAKVIGPALLYNTATLFPAHPNLSSITLPASASRIGTGSSLTNTASNTPAGSFVDSSRVPPPSSSPAAGDLDGSLGLSLLSPSSPRSSSRAGSRTSSPSGRDKKEKKSKRKKKERAAEDSEADE